MELPKDLGCIFLRMQPEYIAFLKFVLESYDDLGLVRTLDVERGEVVVLCPKDMEPETEHMLESLREEIPFVRMSGPPESVSRDWLLNDAQG